MVRKLHSWFRGLSKAGKAGVILASIFVVGAAASPNSSPSSPPPPPPVPAADTIEKQTVTETEEIAFKQTTTEDSSIDKGRTVLKTAGVKGEKAFTYEVTYTNGKETDKKLLSEEVTKQPVDELTHLGTKVAPPPVTAKPQPVPQPAAQANCDPNYAPCIPNVSYDLDCGDIGFTVTVTGSDHHRLDRDNDGYGCE